MTNNSNASYEYIEGKIQSLKTTFPYLREKPNDYVFSALCIKSNLYKNPALSLEEADLKDYIVDGKSDGGVDILLTDPNSETSDLIIAQSKYYKEITKEDVLNAVIKMARFYKDMTNGHYEQVNAKVQKNFLTLNSEVGEESKIHFILYTSALKSGIKQDSVTKAFKDELPNIENFDLQLFFAKDIVEEIKESESRRPNIENGKIKIDKPNNALLYRDSSAIVNVSAFSIKALYAQYNNVLLSRNLRYHIAGRDIDKAILNTISESPESFWMKNNGITIICDDFKIDGKEVKLKNFSVINGGQTTYLLHKSTYISETSDLFLPCKIIKVIGKTEDEKNTFSLEIAKATNSQKSIKKIDLKANSAEQIRFAQAMIDEGIFYQTKRGEKVPKKYKEIYLNTDLAGVGKLCLSSIFQLPCTSRSKPSSIYLDIFYNTIFDSNQKQIAKLSKELLYMDYYFKKVFQKSYDKNVEKEANSSDRIAFAHNARTICIAFVALASRVYYKNITQDQLNFLFSSCSVSQFSYEDVARRFKDIKNINFFIPEKVFNNKDEYENVLYKLFTTIIDAGITSLSIASRYEPGINPSNYLKKDINYYNILHDNWNRLSISIHEIFSNL